MLWGAGRLLLHAALAAWSAVLTLSREALNKILAADLRRVLRLAAVVAVLALVGPTGPFTTAWNPVTDDRGAAARVERAAGDTDAWASVDLAEADVPADTDRPRRARALPPPPPVAKRTALIVGINRATGGRPLPGSITDALNTQEALLGYGFPRENVTTLLEQDASRANILRELDRLAARTPPDGVAVFALATHTRRRGGTNEFLTADGLRVSAPELASALGKVPSKMWVSLATCYAGGYNLPGIVGRNRVATFASSSSDPTYQLGTAGSYLVINMVQSAMLDGRAPESVEAAFAYAERTLRRDRPNRVPSISDGVPGELVLGRMSDELLERHRAAAKKGEDPFFSSGSAGGSSPDAAPPPPSQPNGAQDPPKSKDPDPSKKSGGGGFGVCGRVSWRCSTKG